MTSRGFVISLKRGCEQSPRWLPVALIDCEVEVSSLVFWRYANSRCHPTAQIYLKSGSEFISDAKDIANLFAFSRLIFLAKRRLPLLNLHLARLSIFQQVGADELLSLMKSLSPGLAAGLDTLRYDLFRGSADSFSLPFSPL